MFFYKKHRVIFPIAASRCRAIIFCLLILGKRCACFTTHIKREAQMMHVKLYSLDIANLLDNKNVGILCAETDKKITRTAE